MGAACGVAVDSGIIFVFKEQNTNMHELKLIVSYHNPDSDQSVESCCNNALGHVPAVVQSLGLWPWPMALAYGLGLWPWPMALAYGLGLWPWPMALAYGLGLWPWPMALAYGLGLWPWPMALGLGLLVYTHSGAFPYRSGLNPLTHRWIMKRTIS